MSLLPVLVDARNAYEAHDRDAFDRVLGRIQAALVAVPRSPIRHLDPPALEHRRAEVAAELNAIEAEQQRRHQPTD